MSISRAIVKLQLLFPELSVLNENRNYFFRTLGSHAERFFKQPGGEEFARWPGVEKQQGVKHILLRKIGEQRRKIHPISELRLEILILRHQQEIAERRKPHLRKAGIQRDARILLLAAFVRRTDGGDVPIIFGGIGLEHRQLHHPRKLERQLHAILFRHGRESPGDGFLQIPGGNFPSEQHIDRYAEIICDGGEQLHIRQPAVLPFRYRLRGYPHSLRDGLLRDVFLLPEPCDGFADIHRFLLRRRIFHRRLHYFFVIHRRFTDNSIPQNSVECKRGDVEQIQMAVEKHGIRSDSVLLRRL